MLHNIITVVKPYHVPSGSNYTRAKVVSHLWILPTTLIPISLEWYHIVALIYIFLVTTRLNIYIQGLLYMVLICTNVSYMVYLNNTRNHQKHDSHFSEHGISTVIIYSINFTSSSVHKSLHKWEMYMMISDTHTASLQVYQWSVTMHLLLSLSTDSRYLVALSPSHPVINPCDILQK